jgi:hypothetical protein
VGRAYQRAWQKELGTELADAVIVQRYLFASHPRVARVIRAAAGMTGVTAQVLEFVQGRLSYASLRRRLLLRFPSTVFRMVRERLAADPPRAC